MLYLIWLNLDLKKNQFEDIRFDSNCYAFFNKNLCCIIVNKIHSQDAFVIHDVDSFLVVAGFSLVEDIRITGDGLEWILQVSTEI